MPYQPDYAVPHTIIHATDLNAQFAALKAQLDAQAAQITALQAANQSLAQQLAARPTLQQVLDLIAANAARNVDTVAPPAPALVREPSRPRRVQRDAGQGKRGPGRAEAPGVRGGGGVKSGFRSGPRIIQINANGGRG